MNHEAKVRYGPLRAGKRWYRGYCPCGWEAVIKRQTKGAALTDAEDHILIED